MAQNFTQNPTYLHLNRRPLKIWESGRQTAVRSQERLESDLSRFVMAQLATERTVMLIGFSQGHPSVRGGPEHPRMLVLLRHEQLPILRLRQQLPICLRTKQAPKIWARS